MFFTAAAHLMAAGAVQGEIRLQAQRVKCARMQHILLPLYIAQGNAAHPAHCIGKIFVDHIHVDTDGLKNLRPLVGLNGGNPHFGGNLHNAMEHCMGIILHRRIIVLIQHPTADQFMDGLQCQIGIDGAGAVPQQRGKIMDFSRFPGFQNERHTRPFFRPHQIFIEGGHGQQGGDRHMIFVHAPVT